MFALSSREKDSHMMRENTIASRIIEQNMRKKTYNIFEQETKAQSGIAKYLVCCLRYN